MRMQASVRGRTGDTCAMPADFLRLSKAARLSLFSPMNTATVPSLANRVRNTRTAPLQVVARGLFSARRSVLTLVFAAGVPWLAGCATSGSAELPTLPPEPEVQTLRAGDVVKISFPRAATLDTTQQIRRDGRINLYLVGEVQAADRTPAQLEHLLMEKYSAQLVSKEVRVTVVSSAFTLYVTGAVLHPGRINPDREVTPIEAVMEAGGFDVAKANLKAVAIIRREGADTKNFVVNLQAVLDGKKSDPVYLKPNDIIYVPERRSIF